MNPFGTISQNPKRIIIHSMGEYIITPEGTFSAADFLLNIGLSAHVLIHPDGKKERLRRDDQGAYHAKGFNKDSLGMEFLVPGEHDYSTFLKAIQTDYLTPEARHSGLEQLREWKELHNITQIDRHSDVDPRRKRDPGTGFPWLEFISEI